MLVQVVTPIMNLVMTPLALVVVLVVLDQADGRDPPSLFLTVQTNPVLPIDCANLELLVDFVFRFNLLSWE